jgi:uncharacterized protein YjbI with pentapeptide repeats
MAKKKTNGSDIRVKNLKLIYKALLKAQNSDTADFSNIIFNEAFNIRDIKASRSKKIKRFGKLLDWIEIVDDKNKNTLIYEHDSINLKSVIINKKINFSDSTFCKSIDFSYSTFAMDVSFYITVFEENTNFLYSQFLNKFVIARSKFSKDANFFSSQISGKADLIKTTFLGKVIFSWVQFFQDANFRGATFSDQANFVKGGFFMKVDFRQCFFYQIANFTGAQFKQKTDFSGTLFHERLIFHSIGYTDNTSFKFDNSSIKDGNLVFAPAIPSKFFETRGTANLFKHTTIHNNDNITTMDYQVQEMDLYSKELKWRNRGDIANKIVLFFNKISNKYGSKWSRGVLFTVVVAFIFFILILFFGSKSDVRSIEVWVKGFIGTLNIFNFAEDFAGQNGVRLNAIGAILAYLSKIFVSYGIYQTVAAFRKHGK